eukprot:SAG31_NODE_175_length_21352_cov_3.981508_16_plen_82_part_00
MREQPSRVLTMTIELTDTSRVVAATILRQILRHGTAAAVTKSQVDHLLILIDITRATTHPHSCQHCLRAFLEYVFLVSPSQ